tara:strand:+ start:43 stop:327 length:285 start_codon:yes stop_codon:yes gene_type:complete
MDETIDFKFPEIVDDMKVNRIKDNIKIKKKSFKNLILLSLISKKINTIEQKVNIKSDKKGPVNKRGIIDIIPYDKQLSNLLLNIFICKRAIKFI